MPILAAEAPNRSSFDLIKQNAFQDDYSPNEATYNPSDNAPLSKNKIVTEQATDSFRRAATVYIVYIGTTQSECYTDSSGILV